MTERNDTSVQFSLQELMELERERLESEREAAARAEQRAHEARLLERAARERSEAERAREAEERQRLERSRAREERARLEAIAHAELERARLEVEARAHIEALSRMQAHEREVVAIHRDRGKRALRRIVVATLVALAIVAAGAVALIRDQAHKQDVLRAQLGDLAAQRDDNDRKLKDLEQSYAKATDPANQAAIQARIDALEAKNDELRKELERGRKTGSSAPHAPRAASAGCYILGSGARVDACKPGDSLCACE